MADGATSVPDHLRGNLVRRLGTAGTTASAASPPALTEGPKHLPHADEAQPWWIAGPTPPRGYCMRTHTSDLVDESSGTEVGPAILKWVHRVKGRFGGYS